MTQDYHDYDREIEFVKRDFPAGAHELIVGYDGHFNGRPPELRIAFVEATAPIFGRADICHFQGPCRVVLGIFGPSIPEGWERAHSKEYSCPLP